MIDSSVYGRSVSGDFGQLYMARTSDIGVPSRAYHTTKMGNLGQYYTRQVVKSRKGIRQPVLRFQGLGQAAEKAPLSYKYPWLGGIIKIGTAGLLGGLTALAATKISKKSKSKWAKSLMLPVTLGSVSGMVGFFGAGTIGDKAASIRI